MNASGLFYEANNQARPIVAQLIATPNDVLAHGGKNPRPACPAKVPAQIRGLDVDWRSLGVSNPCYRRERPVS